MPGVFSGALIGAIAGYVWRQRSGASPERIEQLERKTQHLDDQLQRTLGRIGKLEAVQQAAPTAQPEPSAAEPAPAAPGLASQLPARPDGAPSFEPVVAHEPDPSLTSLPAR